MKKRDLTAQKIIEVYIALANEITLSAATFPRLAEKLGIKTPSLYNHFKNLTDLKVQTAIYLHTTLNKRLTEDLIGQSGRQGLRIYAMDYRQFADEYRHVYELLNTVPSFNNVELEKIGRKNNQIILKLLKTFNLSNKELLIKSRAFRSLLNGYIILEQLGYFQNGDLTDGESFSGVVDEFLASLA